MTASFTPGRWWLVDEEPNANARLIAAAPALYGIVKDVAEHFEGTDAPLGNRARAAIAAVRGGES